MSERDDNRRMEPLSLDDLKALYPFVLEAAGAEPDEEKRKLLAAALTVSARPEGPLYGGDAFLHLFAQRAAGVRPDHRPARSLSAGGCYGDPPVPIATVKATAASPTAAARHDRSVHLGQCLRD